MKDTLDDSTRASALSHVINITYTYVWEYSGRFFVEAQGLTICKLTVMIFLLIAN